MCHWGNPSNTLCAYDIESIVSNLKMVMSPHNFVGEYSSITTIAIAKKFNNSQSTIRTWQQKIRTELDLFLGNDVYSATGTRVGGREEKVRETLEREREEHLPEQNDGDEIGDRRSARCELTCYPFLLLSQKGTVVINVDVHYSTMFI